MTLEEIQEGWRFYSADFSVLPGTVTLKRDDENTRRWRKLPKDALNEGTWPTLFVNGRGMTLSCAIANANKAALVNGSHLPSA